MNLYIRYFDSEILVSDVEEAIAFLAGIREIGMNQKIADDIRAYHESDNKFPKRYKVRPKVYFIMIKTDATNMQEFKDYRNRSVTKAISEEQDEDQQQEPINEAPVQPVMPVQPAMMVREGGSHYSSHRDRNNMHMVVAALRAERFGWYEAEYDFKRVVVIPTTGKNEYRDTHFVVRCKAMSGMDCYNRMVEYLRDCVDSRSQFPSAKGRSFSFRYLGACKPLEQAEVNEI